MKIRTLTRVCASIAAISAMVTAKLWLDLRSERETIVELRTELAGSLGRIAAAQGQIKPPLSGLPAVDASGAAPAAPMESQASGPGVVTSGTVTFGNVRIVERELPRNPADREARLAMLRKAIVQSYPGLAESLGLTGEETDKLFDLLAETQLERITQPPIALTGNPETDGALVARMNQNRADLQREQGETLRAMLGETGYARWQQYLPTRSVRIQADSYATNLANAGAPLNGSQLEGLVDVMLGEQKSLRQDIVALGRKVDESNPVSREQAQIALRNRQAASNQRILDSASPQLTAQQLDLLRSQFAQGDAIKEADKRVWERVDSVLLQR